MRMTTDHDTFVIAALPAAGLMKVRTTAIVIVTIPTSQP